MLGLAIALASLAQASSSESVAKASALLKRFDDKLSAASTIEVDYVDTAEYTAPFKDLRQHGHVFLARPGSLRVEISRSRRKQAASPWEETGNNTLRVVANSKQVNVFFHAKSTQVKESETSRLGIQESYPLSSFFDGKKSLFTDLTKADQDGSITEIETSVQLIHYKTSSLDRTITFNREGVVDRVIDRTVDRKQVHTWQLNDIRWNPSVAPSLFVFEKPKDAIPYTTASREEPLLVGDIAPDFSLTDSKGQEVHLSEFRGKVVVLKFWATWCWPCNQSLPDTETLAAGTGVPVVAIAIHDSRAGFDAWLAKHPQYKAIRFAFEDPNYSTVSEGYHVTATPTTLVIGKDGRIVSKVEGFTGAEDGLKSAVEKAQLK